MGEGLASDVRDFEIHPTEIIDAGRSRSRRAAEVRIQGRIWQRRRRVAMSKRRAPPFLTRRHSVTIYFFASEEPGPVKPPLRRMGR